MHHTHRPLRPQQPNNRRNPPTTTTKGLKSKAWLAQAKKIGERSPTRTNHALDKNKREDHKKAADGLEHNSEDN
jgi:hypothetical protein